MLGAVLAGCSSSEPAAEPCAPVEIDPAAYADGMEVAYVTVAPDEPGTGRARFFVASATGGLWVTTIPPTSPEAGIILPMNERARVESTAGIDVDPSAPAFDGLDAGSDEAQRALTCAAEVG